ncbi:MAG: hypothetical protein ACREJ2_15680 [Planctomycetota bacterium]
MARWFQSDRKFLVYAVALFVLGGTLQWWHLSVREELGMPLDAQQGSADLVKAGIYSLGSVRGLVATALWMEVTDARYKRDYVRLKGDCDLLMEIQPNFTSTCKFLAYTEVFDLTDQMPGLDEKYYWVRSGLNILDQGYRRNRRESALPSELGFLYSFRFNELRDDGAALALKDATSPRKDESFNDPPDMYLSDRHQLAPLDGPPDFAFQPSSTAKPRWSLQMLMPDGIHILRQPRCIECFYWSEYYNQLAAAEPDANLQAILTDLQDCHKRIAWYSDWPEARAHLQMARDINVRLDEDALKRGMTLYDAFRENFMGEYFYLLLDALPRRARSAQERDEMAAEVRKQWAWYQSYFQPPRYPKQAIFTSPRQAADWYAQEQQGEVAGWDANHPDDHFTFFEQLPR